MMSGPESISLAVEVPKVAQEWGNALPILHEVRHALERLATTGAPGIIDLRAIPFGPGDEARLLARLGRGEVEAVINALGETRIWESAIPAVWVIDHYNVGRRAHRPAHRDRPHPEPAPDPTRGSR